MSMSAPSQVATPPAENTWYEEFLKQMRQAAEETAKTTARAAAETAKSTAQAADELSRQVSPGSQKALQDGAANRGPREELEMSRGNGPAAAPPPPVEPDANQSERARYEAALDETMAI